MKVASFTRCFKAQKETGPLRVTVEVDHRDTPSTQGAVDGLMQRVGDVVGLLREFAQVLEICARNGALRGEIEKHPGPRSFEVVVGRTTGSIHFAVKQGAEAREVVEAELRDVVRGLHRYLDGVTVATTESSPLPISGKGGSA